MYKRVVVMSLHVYKGAWGGLSRIEKSGKECYAHEVREQENPIMFG